MDKIKIHEYILAVYTLQEKLKITGSEKKTGKIKKNAVFMGKKRFIYQRKNYYFKNTDLKQNKLHHQ